MKPVIHEFVSPINRYKAWVVWQGFVPKQLSFLDGKPCFVVSSNRIRLKKGWGYFNSLHIQFLDGRHENMGAAAFNKKAKPIPLDWNPEGD